MNEIPLHTFYFLDGRATFKSFLKSEFSEENLEFWVACEDYKKIKSPVKMAEKAKQIYEEFIQTEAPKEVGTGGQVAECIHLRARSARFPGTTFGAKSYCTCKYSTALVSTSKHLLNTRSVW